MKCPKCAGEIPFYDLKPNCRHCGVNIMYYTQEAGLARDAKRTELESAVARMMIARIKANFIGGKLQIARMVMVLIAAAVLLIPFGGARYDLPFFHESFSAGIIGIIQASQNDFLLSLPFLPFSSLLSGTALACVIPACMLCVVALLDVVIFVFFLLGFINITDSTKRQKTASLVGIIIALAAQAAIIVVRFAVKPDAFSSPVLGFGALAAAVMFAVMYLLNRAILNVGIEPKFRENDLKRKELLKKVRSGEVDIDSLPLPVFESEAEREERLKALEEALKAEEEGKEL
ncbi:MAG: hypothetical protein IKW76_13350 [Clostridia bacterium]|nr:hypothetical protein [Clostridia bacterium]